VNKNISSAASVYQYTATADALVFVSVRLSNAAGNGDYVVYLKRQWYGSPNPAVILPKTTATAASGETILEFITTQFYISNGDVIDVMIDGQAGDTSVNGDVQIVSLNFSKYDSANDGVTLTSVERDTIVNQTLGGVADAVLDASAASYDDPGTIGEAINNAGSGSVTVNSYLAVSQTDAQNVASGDLSITTFNTFAQAVTSTTTSNLVSADNIWFAVKEHKTDADAKSIIFIDNSGLLYAAGRAYATAADGSLSVTGVAGAWSVAVDIEEDATALLGGFEGEHYAEIKALVSGDTVIVWSGSCIISHGIVKAIA
jgi:hypothetical protein